MLTAIKLLCRIGVIALASLASFHVVGNEACMVVGDRHLRPSDYYHPSNMCYYCSFQDEGRCKGQNKVVAPNRSLSVDPVIVPHRGIWGFPRGQGAPENTFMAVKCAKDYSYDVVEIDVMRTADGKAVLSHYFSLAWAGLSGDTTAKTQAELVTMKVKMRNGELHPTETFGSLDDVVSYAYANGVLLLVDIKVREGGGTPEGRAAFVSTLDAIIHSVDIHQLGTMAIKVPSMDYDSFMDEVNYQIPDYASVYKGRFQWAYIANKSVSMGMDDVLPQIEKWVDQEKNNLAFVETLVYAPDSWTGQPFQWPLPPGTPVFYQNLIDFAARYTPALQPGEKFRPDGMRAGVWSLDSMGERGTYTREYKWRHFGTFPNDKRGVIRTTMDYYGVPHALITTDRFDVFQQYLQPDWHPAGEIREVVCNP